MGAFFYRLIERLDGERGGWIILPYKAAQRIKLLLLRVINCD